MAPQIISIFLDEGKNEETRKKKSPSPPASFLVISSFLLDYLFLVLIPPVSFLRHCYLQAYGTGHVATREVLPTRHACPRRCAPV